MSEIEKWLEGLGLEKYAISFQENDIDLDVISELENKDFESLGVTLGHRKKLIRAITMLSSNASIDSNPVNETAKKLRPEVMDEPERRYLSLMFCDLADSTQLASMLDIEDMHEINRAYQEVCSIAIKRFDGFVARYMGDGVLAYFGYPTAHEDDSERAVQAGLETSVAIKNLGKTLSLPGDIDLSVRVGIATGPVVVEVIGEGASQESAVVGEAPNRAARLQGLADANSVVIDLQTRQLLGEKFDLEGFGKHTLKGISDDVQVWQVNSALSKEDRRNVIEDSSQTPMIGRDEEFGLMKSRWQRTCQGEGQVVLLMGEAGIGKSRISRALMESVRSENHVLLRFYCSSYHTQSPLHPFISHIERQCGFKVDQSNSEKQRIFEALVMDQYGYSRGATGVIASLLSIELDDSYDISEKDPISQMTLLQDAVIQNIVSHSEKGSVMFVLEDVHWIDPTSRKCLDLLVERAHEKPIFVLFSSRPNNSFEYNYSHVTRLSLSKLSKQQVSSMIYSMVRSKGLDKTIAEKIVEKSDGIPLFIEEVTKMIVESQVSTEHNGNNVELRIPDSLQASLLSRLDRLGDVKRIAQMGSVVGDTFNSEILAHLCSREVEEIQPMLESLVENEIVLRHETPAGIRYRFWHVLLRDAAYESLLKRNRVQLHGEVAAYLKDVQGSLTGRDDEIIAHHYSEAGVTENAYEHWTSAGMQALESGATREAAGLFDNAKRFMPVSSEDKNDLESMYRLEMAHGEALKNSTGAVSSGAHDAFRNAVKISKRLGNIEQQIDALDYQFAMHFNATELDESLKIAKKMLQLGKDNDNLVAIISGYQVLGMTYYVLGEFDQARENLEAALDTKGQTLTGINAYPSMTMDYLSFVLCIMGEMDGGKKMCEDAYKSAVKETGYSVPSALSNGSFTQMFLGNIEAVRDNAAELIVLAKENGLFMYLNRGLLFENLARARIDGDEAALEFVVDAIQDLLISKEKIETTCLLGFVAETQISFSQNDSAAESLKSALKIARKNNERFYESELHRLNAELEIARKKKSWRENSKKHLKKARALAEAQNANGWLNKISETENRLRES